MRHSMRLLGLLLLLGELSGCALFHELQPHRLRRLNRGQPPSLDPEFLSLDSQPVLNPQLVDHRSTPSQARAQSE